MRGVCPLGARASRLGRGDKRRCRPLAAGGSSSGSEVSDRCLVTPPGLGAGPNVRRRA